MISECAIVKALLSLLQNRMPDELAAIDTEEDDDTRSLPLETIADEEERGSRLPSAIVTIGKAETTEKDRIVRRETFKATVSIRPSGERRALQCYRYAAALSRVIAADPTLGGIATASFVTAKDFLFPGYAGREDGYRALITVTVSMEAA